MTAMTSWHHQLPVWWKNHAVRNVNLASPWSFSFLSPISPVSSSLNYSCTYDSPKHDRPTQTAISLFPLWTLSYRPHGTYQSLLYGRLWSIGSDRDSDAAKWSGRKLTKQSLENRHTSYLYFINWPRILQRLVYVHRRAERITSAEFGDAAPDVT